MISNNDIFSFIYPISCYYIVYCMTIVCSKGNFSRKHAIVPYCHRTTFPNIIPITEL